MADTKISALTALTAANSDDADVIAVVDTDAVETKKMLLSELKLLTPVALGFALSDETTAITTGTAKLTVRAPYAFTLTSVTASLTTSSSSGIPTVDINLTGTGTVLSTKLTIDASETTSTTAAAAAVISVSAITADGELTFDIDVAGTGAAGLKVWLHGTRV